MNIGKLAETTGVTSDTLRYYEKEGLIEPPARSPNGYRHYDATHVARLRFVRSAQALGFSLAEIRDVLPRLAAGAFGREDIETRLNLKLAEIEAHIRQLDSLKQELQATFAQLTCTPGQPLSLSAATADAAAESEKPRQRRKLRGGG